MCVLSHRSHPGHIDSNNPGFVASGDDLGYIRTWLLEDPWTPLLNIEAHEAAVLAMVLKKPMDNSDIDRYRLLTAGADKTFRVFDAMTGECLGRVSNHSGPIQALAVLRLNGPILSSGRPGKELRWKEDVVLTAGLDKRINFWRLNDMSLMYCMDRDKPVRGVAATCLPHPVIIATSMDEGIEILDLQLYDGIPPELRHWVDNHEEEDINKKDYDDEGDAR